MLSTNVHYNFKNNSNNDCLLNGDTAFQGNRYINPTSYRSNIRMPIFIDEETATQKDAVTDSRSQR